MRANKGWRRGDRIAILCDIRVFSPPQYSIAGVGHGGVTVQLQYGGESVSWVAYAPVTRAKGAVGKKTRVWKQDLTCASVLTLVFFFLSSRQTSIHQEPLFRVQQTIVSV